MNETICLGLTTYKAGPVPVLMEWIADLLVYGARGARFDYVGVHDRAPVEYARNCVVGEFLAGGADRLWFIDADMIPNRTTLGLLDHDADIVCGMARWFNFDSAGLSVQGSLLTAVPHFDPPVLHQAKLDDVGPVDAGGTGCMIIRRQVLDDRRLWLEDPPDDPAIPPVFRYVHKANGERIVGEDVDFCLRAKALGYSILGSPHEGMGHAKTCNVDHVEQLVRRSVGRAVLEARP